LNWLGAWLNLAMEEEWTNEKKRYFIQNAYAYFKQKGTAAGIRWLVNFYTGVDPIILSPLNYFEPLILLKERSALKLGINTRIMQTPVRGFRLGDDSILSRTAIRSQPYKKEDPFLRLAHRFTILLNMNLEEYSKIQSRLKNILNDEKPAHTEFSIRIIGDTRTRKTFFIGVNSKVAEYFPFCLGLSATVGYSTIRIKRATGQWIGRNLNMTKRIIMI